MRFNNARGLYLGTYSRIDSIDYLVKKNHLTYRYWKYWNTIMFRGMSLLKTSYQHGHPTETYFDVVAA